MASFSLLSTFSRFSFQADRVQFIYRAFCTEILDVPEKSLSELPFECQFTSDMIDMHQKSEPLLLLFTTMRCFVMDFGDANTDLTMCDLINPQPKRTRKLLSVVADYTNFHRVASQVFEKTSSEYDHARREIEEGLEQVRLAEERKNALRSDRDSRKRKENGVASQVFEKTSSEYDHARREIEEGLEQVRLAEERKNALRSDRDSRKRKENGLLAESGKKNAILTELMKETQATECNRDAIIKAIEEGKQEIVKAFSDIEAHKNEIEHLSKGVVKSPVRVRNDVDEQRLAIRRLQESCDAERQRISGNNESMSVIEQASKLLDDRSNELDRLRDFQAGVNVLEHERANSEALVAEAAKYKMQREEALSRLVKLSEDEEKGHSRALEVYSARLEDLKLRKEALVDIMNSLRKNASSIREETMQLQKEMVRLRNERTEETDLARRYCLELRRRFLDLLEKASRSSF
ncbi:hypothetical protein COOONC_06567 [Cooperia oncophora]